MDGRSPRFRVRFQGPAEPPPRSSVERFAAIGDLFDTAVAMRRARFLREHPGANDAEAERAVEEWLTEPRDDHDPTFVPVTSERLRDLVERGRARGVLL